MLKIKLVVLFIFAHIFMFGQSCLKIKYMQIVGKAPAKMQMDYVSDFKNSSYTLTNILNANDTIVRESKEIKGGTTIHYKDIYTVGGMGEGKYIIYKNFDSGKLYISENSYGGKKHPVIVKEDLREYNWDIKQERDTILGFNVQKAVGEVYGRVYDVWFTTEIPYSGGPRMFHGLPGMVLSAKARDRDFNVEFYPIEINIEKGQTCSLDIPLEIYPDREIITINEHKRLMKKAYDKTRKYENSRTSGHRRKNIGVQGIEIR